MYNALVVAAGLTVVLITFGVILWVLARHDHAEPDRATLRTGEPRERSAR